MSEMEAAMSSEIRCRAKQRRADSGIVVLFVSAAALIGGTVRADEIIVPKDLPTIQAAVDVAQPGDSVRIWAGTYEEQIIIGKNLTLRGADAHRTVIQAPTPVVPYGQNIPLDVPAATVIEVTDGAVVEISGITVSGPIPCAVDMRGIVVIKGATLKLEDS